MLDEILELNRRAAARGDFDIAYHLLMAAPHCADHTEAMRLRRQSNQHRTKHRSG
jgi:hypothetical protein